VSRSKMRHLSNKIGTNFEGWRRAAKGGERGFWRREWDSNPFEKTQLFVCKPACLQVHLQGAVKRMAKARMASTRLNDMGCRNRDDIERRLVHQESSDVRRAYMHAAEYWPERVKMMQAWADYLDELREAGRVIPLRRENA